METNELPEEVRKQIDEEADTYSTATVWISRHPYSNSTPAGHEFNEYISGKSYKDGAEFGYRLALQSKEEQLKAKDEQIKGLINRRVGHTVLDGLYEEQKSTIDSLTSEVARLKEALIKVQSLLSQSTDKP